MRLIGKTDIDFMGKRVIAYTLSGILLVISIASLATKGLNFGIDFTGGTLVEVGYEQAVELDGVRQQLATAGFGDAIVQHFGSAKDVIIRLAPREGMDQDSISDNVVRALRAGGEQVDLRRKEFVGPQVGDELAEKGGLAMLYALIGILIYVALRFEWKFSVGSVAALVHDVVISLGVFSILQLEFNLPVLAALLAIIGYSLNDTIVVFDRIRENFRKMRKSSPKQAMNRSINQTLARTLMTSFTTMLVLLALLIFGGEVIYGFSLALIVGILVGTYSSIYVASTTALALGVSKADLMPVQKEGVDEKP